MMSSDNEDIAEERKLLLTNNNSDSGHHVYQSLQCPVNEQDPRKRNSTAVVETAKFIARWYICGIFSLFGMMQGAIWNTWGPISDSAACAFGFPRGEIDLLTNWGPISFLFSMPVVMWMLDRYGLRLPCVLSALAVAVGTGLRCLPLSTDMIKYSMHAGQILNGIAGCAIMASPPMLSNAWFPPHERVTATSLTTLFNYFGTGIAYIIGPVLVQQPTTNFSGNGSLMCIDPVERDTIRKGIMHLMYLEFGISLFAFVSMLAYFPSRPPKPPSISAFASRMDFFSGLKELRHQHTFIIVTVTFALVLGSYGGWTGVLSLILKELNVSQDEAGRIGFFMTFVGCLAGFAVGWFADRFKGHIKVMIIGLFGIAFLSYFYYINMAEKWIKVPGFEQTNTGIWVVCIVIGIAMNAAVPLGMEMGADSAYPTSEATSASIIVWFFNLLSFVLLLVLQLTDPAIPNYLMLGSIGLSIPLLAFFSKEPSNRMRMDAVNSEASTSSDHETDENFSTA